MGNSQRLDIGHVLCPVDFSAISDMALRYAAVAARQFKARLTVLHAERFEFPRYLTRDTKAQLAGEVKGAKDHAEADLRGHVEALLGAATALLEVQYAVEESEPAAAVLRRERETQVDLVVMGTHGLGGFKRVIMGSTAEAVVRQCQVPVFTVRPKAQAFIDGQRPDADPAIDVILCPLIPEPAFLGSLHYAAALAERFGAALKVLQVVEDDAPLDQAGAKLRELTAAEIGRRCSWSVEVHAGRAAEQIVSLAGSQSADLLVVGARRRPFADVAILGRTTELVLRHAPVPVLAVPLPGKV